MLLVMVAGTGTVEEGSQVELQAHVGQRSQHFLLSCSTHLAAWFPWQLFQKTKRQKSQAQARGSFQPLGLHVHFCSPTLFQVVPRVCQGLFSDTEVHARCYQHLLSDVPAELVLCPALKVGS